MPVDEVPWPTPPREPGPWNGGPPVAPPGNTPLPPLPGAGGVVHGASAPANPWANQTVPDVNIPPSRPAAAQLTYTPGVPGVPPQPGAPLTKPKADRAPTWLLVASAIVVLALIAGVAYVVVKGGRQYPSAWDDKTAPIAEWVAAERELDFKHPVQVNFLSEEEYTARATEGGDDGTEEAEQYYADQVAQLRALGFISGDVDLAAASDTLSDSGTLAYYDQALEQVFVRGTELTPDVRVTLAHELTHVLQDQHFDLERLGDFGDGRDQVLRAIAEGDAGLVEEAYVADVLTDEERAAYEQTSTTAGEEANEELDAKVPPILTTLFAAPYILGPGLVASLDASDGWAAINDALTTPPTEEVLFDPLVYGTDGASGQVATVTAPDGVEVLEQAEFGPTTWFLMLASRIDAREALRATDGWGGDQYVVYRQDDEVCVDIVAVGDTAEDTEELGAAAAAWAEKSPEGSATAEVVDGEVRLTSCDPGTEAELPGGEVTPDLLSLPVVRTQVGTDAKTELDATDEEADCFGNGVIDAFTVAELTGDGEAVFSAEGQQKIGEVARSCGLVG